MIGVGWEVVRVGGAGRVRAVGGGDWREQCWWLRFLLQ